MLQCFSSIYWVVKEPGLSCVVGATASCTMGFPFHQFNGPLTENYNVYALTPNGNVRVRKPNTIYPPPPIDRYIDLFQHKMCNNMA